ncbi:MAG TPA: PqiC family protein [Myxococcaceae bacterium]|nr:PqiC family protein [Myxococcaceae bacterium]
MTGTNHLRSPPFLACALSLALAGCFGTSRPPRFYTLEPLQVPEGPGATSAELTLAVGPVELPDYVDRPQIVTRSGNNELVIAEFERWGGSLEKQISGSLVATLGDRLASRQIAVVPWRSAVLSSGTPDRVRISVSRFDGVPGHSVVLQARWELCTQSGGKEESLLVKEASVTEQIDGPDYAALVAAMQRALVRLGGQVADSVVAAKQVARAP